MRFLVTAGNTREKIDAVRDWGNIFTGNTGLAIARAISEIAPVDLLTSNRAHLQELPPQISGSAFTTHAELRGALAALVARQKYDAIFMTAAVADYRPAGVYSVLKREVASGDSGAQHETWVVQDVSAGKVKSTHKQIAVLAEPTEKIVDLFRSEWKYSGLLVKFKLEVGIDKNELLKIGQASRVASGANYLVANTLDMVEGPSAGAFLIAENGHEWVPREALPRRMADLIRANCPA
jgi:phosphopantothenate---cysteine ligase (CTP)